MLRIAVQAKGRLFEETMALLGESDIKLSTFLSKFYFFVMMIFRKR